MTIFYKAYFIILILTILYGLYIKNIYFPQHIAEALKTKLSLNSASSTTKFLIYSFTLLLLFLIIVGALLMIIFIIHL